MYCKNCGKKLKDDRYDYCNVDCRKEKKLSLKGERNFILKIQNPNHNKENYSNSSKKLKILHKKFGHLVNVPC